MLAIKNNDKLFQEHLNSQNSIFESKLMFYLQSIAARVVSLLAVHKELLSYLKAQISMDGKSRVLDNIFIERFWLTLKYEKIYQELPGETLDLHQLLAHYIEYYNTERIHHRLETKRQRNGNQWLSCFIGVFNRLTTLQAFVSLWLLVD